MGARVTGPAATYRWVSRELIGPRAVLHHRLPHNERERSVERAEWSHSLNECGRERVVKLTARGVIHFLFFQFFFLAPISRSTAGVFLVSSSATLVSRWRRVARPYPLRPRVPDFSRRWCRASRWRPRRSCTTTRATCRTRRWAGAAATTPTATSAIPPRMTLARRPRCSRVNSSRRWIATTRVSRPIITGFLLQKVRIPCYLMLPP